MYVVLGGTGHVGAALTDALLERGEIVTVVSRDPAKARALEERGARHVIADAREPDQLSRAYQYGERLFILNPPADPSQDTQALERETVANVVAALEGSPIKKVVAHSTFGARAGDLMGDLNVLYEMEKALERSGIPTSINRAAYYMSNWEMALTSAKEEGVVRTFFPADLKIPMVAPQDVGRAAAKLITAPVEHSECVHVEGPMRYSSTEVAAAFAAALGRDVRLEVVPERDWTAAFKSLGFSDRAALSYANMTRIVCDGDFAPESTTLHGEISLEEYIAELVAT